MERRTFGGLLSKNVNSPSRRRLSLVQSIKKGSTALSVSGRSNQSTQIICRTASHLVENFGSPQPVLVTEALTFVERNAAISVGVSLDGWAWLVCGRRLLVWYYKTVLFDNKQSRAYKSQCHELQLPQSDLAHKSDCIAVWLPPGQQVPSCMAVSPEGIVRYWENVANEELSIETSAELQGQEVDCLTYIPEHGCILATTTCTVALLQPQVTSGKSSINCRVLRTSKGWFGGIGRRMSTLIFGAIPQSPVQETKVVKVVCTVINEKLSRVLISAGNSLQYWSFQIGEQEKMEFDEDIGHIVMQAFQKRLMESSGSHPQNLNTCLIDMQPMDEGIVFLMAAYNTEPTSFTPIHFAVGLIPLSNAQISNSFKWFIPLKINNAGFNKDSIESAIKSYRFIISGWDIIIYDKHNVIIISNLSEYEVDNIDLARGEKDSILGGALCSGTPVLFTRNLGLITITASDFANQDFNQSYSDANLSVDAHASNLSLMPEQFMSLLNNEEIREMFYSSDNVKQLQAAFLLSVRQNKEHCEDILTDLFPMPEDPVMDIDAPLDTTVLKVAEHLIDDYPANDPRWANYRNLNFTLNAVLAMQIPHQLEGKQKAMDLYVIFLKDHGLWKRFCAVTYRNTILNTSHVLGEFMEKIIAMIGIYNLQIRYPEPIDTAIERSLQPESYVSEDLSANDIFYREVSEVHNFFSNLVQIAVEQAQSERPAQQIAQYILQVNSIILGILHEVVKYRQYNAEKFSPPKTTTLTEYLPWTASPGNYGLKICLNSMQNFTLKHGVHNTSDMDMKNELFEQLVGLIDLILDGRKCHLESVRNTEKFAPLLKQYEAERSNLIQPLIKEEQYENAVMLAEKYCDFASLIQICELTNNKSRLDMYMKKFANQDFAGFLFSWYVKEGRPGELVEKCRRGGVNELTEKLLQHPILSWVQAALAEDFDTSAQTLYSLALEEVKLVTRKKSMLSLSKLAFLATDDSEEKLASNIQNIDKELNLIAHQEDVPIHVLDKYGYDVEKLRVLSPVELINLYTCIENQTSNEYDFKKALDLLDYIDQKEEEISYKNKIWARAARCNEWDMVDKNPEQQIQETVFFKVLDLVHVMEYRIKDMLPPIESILSEPELGDLATSTNFQYLIKLIYEFAYNNYC
ncbi:nuclear pore complex protein Nup133 [Copidosoma floridanum]|uniref:nuclear pore complex protein Nup133 n=1 Tax=Copidosoma floridanum TaxID=29053 RepID=UPI0006C96ADD|nr:nuclear pore complex protein Nup133 [Copidosoma floridanum]